MVKTCAFLVSTSFVQSPPNERGRLSIKNLKASKMKKLLLFLFLLCSMSAFAQDVIVKKDGSTVVCRVIEVTSSEITYKKWSDLNGSNYVMDKSLVSAINYENGKKETFSETTSLYLPNNQNDGVQVMNDNALLRMDVETDKAYKKIKRLKTWGWIGGGALTATGLVLTITGVAGSDGFQKSNGDAAIGGGVGCIVVGAGLTTTCLILAHKQKKKLDALQTSSIYRYDIPFSNGSSLSVGADLMNDRIMNKRAVGIGLSYNF